MRDQGGVETFESIDGSWYLSSKKTPGAASRAALSSNIVSLSRVIRLSSSFLVWEM